jgi:phage repressor protein C with HTH and peptisase S24 domain
VARLLGVHKATVGRWLKEERGGKRASLDQMLGYMQKLGLSPEPYFSAGPGSGEYVQVPWLEARASMGGGSLVVSKAVVSYLSFRTDWLLGKGAPDGMVVINADGDSMAPTIDDGAVVLVNEASKRPVNNRIFFVCYGEELFLKRLKVDAAGRVAALVSDNGNREQPLEPGVFFEIIGRALWCGKEL